MQSHKVMFLSSTALVLAAVAVGPAFAQAEGPSLAAPTAAAPVADEGGLGEILVTARKRSESVQDIPVTVQALGGEALQQSAAKDLLQAVRLVPGVIFSRAPDDGLALTFRGLGTIARSQAFDLAQALFVDGVFMGKGRLYTTSFFDVDRMEFIKGTQSTMLGKNASLGAISVITRQPGDNFSFEGRAAFEFENGGPTIDAAADLPINDRISIRLAGHFNDLDGWVKNDTTKHDGPEQKDLGLRATLRARVTDGFTLTAAYQHARNEQVGASYQIISSTLPPSYGDGNLDGHTSQFTNATSNGDTYHDTQSDIGSLKGELEIGDHTLIAQSAYIHYKLGFVDDFDFSPETVVDFIRDERYRQFTQELRIQSPSGGKLEYMAGVFYLDSHWTSVEHQNWGVPAFPPPPDPASGQLFNGSYINTYVQDSKSFSAFASGAYKFSDAFRLAGGIRWTHETKDVVFGRTTNGPLTVWNTIANPPFDPTPLALRNNFFDGNISLQYDFSRNVMAFVSFGHGSKSGGFAETNTVAIPPFLLDANGKVPAALVDAGSRVGNEYAKTYEVGIKTTLFDRRMRFNVTGFWTEVKGFQDTVFTGGPLGFITFNGPARSRGVELESSFQVTPEFRFDGSFTYTDATGVIQPIDPATSAPAVDGSGDPVFARYRRSQAPKVIFNLGANYEQSITDALNIRLNAGVRHRSSMFNQRQEQYPSKALTTLDLSIGIASSDDKWGIDLIGKNVTNEIVEDFASPTIDPRPGAFFGAHMASPTQTRTITLAVRVKF